MLTQQYERISIYVDVRFDVWQEFLQELWKGYFVLLVELYSFDFPFIVFDANEDGTSFRVEEGDNGFE